MGLNEQRAEFESVALQHLDALYGFALVLTGRSSDAEDLVQDTYIRALQFFHRYEQGTNCKAWLFTMMKRIFLNQVPKRAREVLCPDQDGPEGAESAGSLDYYAGLVDCTHDRKDEVFRQDVVKALELLPDSFRVVVILRDVEGFSYGEIAQMLDCPMGTVMSRLARGRDVLRQLLCAYANQDSRKLTHVKRIATDA
jgi:RNA polymerase sigma-70 factor (ECF subfamily)